MQALSCLDRLLPRVADFASSQSTAAARALPLTHVHQHASRGRTAAQGVLPGRFYWRRDARHRCAPPNYVPLCCGRSAHWQQRRRPCRGVGRPGAPSKKINLPSSARRATSRDRCGNQPAVRAAAASRTHPRRRRAVTSSALAHSGSMICHAQVPARGQSFYAVRPHRVRAAPRRPRAPADLRDDGHCES